MQVTIRYFGVLAEKVGNSKEIISTKKNIRSDQLIKKLDARYQFPKNINFKVAVNQQIISDDLELKANDEIVLLPPFAGG